MGRPHVQEGVRLEGHPGVRATEPEKAKYNLEQAESKKKLLAKYTGPKTIKSLQVDVDKARNDELDRKASWKREEAREAELEHQLDRI